LSLFQKKCHSKIAQAQRVAQADLHQAAKCRQGLEIARLIHSENGVVMVLRAEFVDDISITPPSDVLWIFIGTIHITKGFTMVHLIFSFDVWMMFIDWDKKPYETIFQNTAFHKIRPSMKKSFI